MKQLLNPIFRMIWNARLVAYKSQFIKTVDVHKPVISIGNLTFGGTGKTPITSFLLSRLLSDSFKPSVVSRGYGGQYAEAQEVDFSKIGVSNPAQYFGDEITWLKRKFPNVPMAVARKRPEGCKLLIDQHQIDLIVADDGFQHWKLKRDLDIVLIDASEPVESLKMFPAGRGREPLEALRRADAIVYTKRNWASENDFKALQHIVSPYLKNNCLACEIDFELGEFNIVNGVSLAQRGVQSEQKSVLISGIGRPELFEKMVRDKKLNFKRHFIFKDHHSFSQHDLNHIQTWCEKEGIDRIYTTEKDWEKLKALKIEMPVLAAELKLRPGKNFVKLYDQITHLVH